MISTANNTASCGNCAFVTFCMSDKKNPRLARQVNMAVKRHRQLRRKEVLCLPKNRFQNLYVIQQGAVKTYQVEPDGKELIRGFYLAGEILGYEAIYSGQYPFSAVALSETIVCEIPYENFLELMYSRPSLQRRMLSLISKQLNTGSYLASTTAEQRLAGFLLDLSSRLHPSEQKSEFLLPMSRQDIGNYLRLTAETISRIFSRLQKNKIISISHKKIHLLQANELQKIADGLFS